MEIHQLQQELNHILTTIEEKASSFFAQLHKSYRMSAGNLFRYLTIRSLHPAMYVRQIKLG